MPIYFHETNISQFGERFTGGYENSGGQSNLPLNIPALLIGTDYAEKLYDAALFGRKHEYPIGIGHESQTADSHYRSTNNYNRDLLDDWHDFAIAANPPPNA